MIDLKKLWDAMPRDVQKKISLHDLKRTTDAYNADPLREAARYAMQRMETIRETHPDIALDSDIESIRKALAIEDEYTVLRDQRDEARREAELWRDTTHQGELQYRGAPSATFSWENA